MIRLGVLSLIGFLILGLSSSAWSYNPRERDVVNNEKPPELQGIGIQEKLGEQLPLDLTFTDEHGELVTLGQFFDGDKPVVLSLVYYTCPSLCNIHLNGLMDGIDQLKYTPGKEFELVFVSFEPYDSTDIAQAKKEAYLEQYNLGEAADHIHFLLGYEDNAKKLADSVGFSYRWDEDSAQWAHSSAAIFASPKGKVTRYLHGVVFEERNLRLAVTEAADGKVGDIIDQIMLFCFNYDPADNQYAIAAFKVMRLGGAVMVGLLALWLLPFWWRRRRNAVEGVR